MTLPDGFRSGVVEAVPGRPWNTRQRHQLFGWMRDAGLNTYLYAPQDELKRRVLWAEAYDEVELTEVAAVLRDARRHGVEFIYSVTLDVDWELTRVDPLVAALDAKFSGFATVDCRRFAVFGGRPGSVPAILRQADVANRVSQALRSRIPDAVLAWAVSGLDTATGGGSGASGQAGMEQWGRALAPQVSVLWPARRQLSAPLDPARIREVSTALGRQPILLERVRDEGASARVPLLTPAASGLEALRCGVAGVLLYPNTAHELNHVLVHTFGAGLRSPGGASAEGMWRKAMEDWLPCFEVWGGEAVTLADLEALAGLFPVCGGEPAADRDADETRARLKQKFERLKNRELYFALESFLIPAGSGR